MVAYYPSGGRFPDFVLFHAPRRHHNEFTYEGGPAHRNRDLSNKSTTLFFSGLAVVGHELVCAAPRFAAAIHPRVATQSGLKSFAGCYTAVLRFTQRVAVVNDFFGLCPLYYYSDGRRVIISNRTHLISLMMDKYGIKRMPNMEVICTSLASHHRLFLHPYSHETVVSGLRICPVDCVLVISDHCGLTVVKKSEFSSALASHWSSQGIYRGLIEQAAGEIKANATAAINSSEFSYHILDISGGKDSRLVFGSVASAGLLAKCFTRTEKTEFVGDLETGIAISQMFGCRLDRGGRQRRYYKRSQFGLGFWRSMNAGVNHRFGMGNWPTMWQCGSTIRLNGGCGEVYRDMWGSERLLSQIDTPRRFGDRCRPDLDPKLRDLAFQSLWRSISSMPGDDAAAKICNHYMFFRNRFHFGMPAYNEWYGYVPFSPLQSIPLLTAACLLHPVDRMQGRAIFDVTHRLMPQLNQLPFGDGSTWPSEFDRGHHFQHAAGSTLPPFSVELKKAYMVAEAARKRSLAVGGVKVDQLLPGQSIHAVLRNQASAALLRMRECDARLAKLFDKGFVEWTSNLWKHDISAATSTASKVLAVYDLCFEPVVTALELHALPYCETYSDGGFSAATFIHIDRID